MTDAEPKDASKGSKARPQAQTPPTPPTSKPEVEIEKKKVERVVSPDGVIEAKPGIGKKFVRLFTRIDAKGAANYVVLDVLVPAARDMLADVGTKFVERIFYPDTPMPGRRIYGPTAGRRSAWGNSAGGGYRPPSTRPPSGRAIETRALNQRPSTEYVLTYRNEAEEVLARMGDLLEVYQVVSVADLHDLIGIDSVHTDNKYGWDSLRGVAVKPVRDGYVLTLPAPDPINV